MLVLLTSLGRVVGLGVLSLLAILAVLAPFGVLGILAGSLTVPAPLAATIIARILLVALVGFALGVRLGLRPRTLG